MKAPQIDVQNSIDPESIKRIEGVFLRLHRSNSNRIRNRQHTPEVLEHMQRYFQIPKMWECIKPLLDLHVAGGEDFEKLGNFMARCYGYIISLEVDSGETFSGQSLAETFFQPGGQFDHFAKKYGNDFVVLPIAYQVSGRNKPMSTEDLDVSFGFLEPFSPEAKRSLVGICEVKKGEEIDRILQVVMKTLLVFIQAGKGALAEDYLKALRAKPLFQEDGTPTSFSKPHFALKEMEALQKLGELREVVLVYAADLYQQRGVECTFFPKARMTVKNCKLPIRVVVDALIEQAKGDTGIVRKALELPSARPDLGQEAHFISFKYLRLEKNFPGGVDAFCTLIEELRPFIYTHGKAGKHFFMDLTIRASSKGAPASVPFWDLGKRVMKYLREESNPYLDVEKYSPVLRKLMDEDFQAFETAVTEGMQLAFQMNVLLTRNSIAGKAIFSAYLRHYGDPHLPAFLDGLAILIRETAIYFDEDPERKMKDAEERVENILASYIFSAEGGSKEKLNDIDYVGWALGVKFSGLDAVRFIEPKDAEDYAESAVECGGGSFVWDPEVPCEDSELMLKVLRASHEYRRENNEENRESLASLAEQMDAEIQTTNEKVKTLVDLVKRDVSLVTRLNDWRAVLSLRDEETLTPHEWIYRASSVTQLGACAGALFLALGLGEVCSDFDDLEWTVPADVLEPIFPREELLELLSRKRTIHELLEDRGAQDKKEKLLANVRKALPYVIESIRAARMAYPGLMAVGTKIEAMKNIKNSDFRFIMDLAGLGDVRTTPFQLKHNGRSLVCPPTPSALEQKLLIMLFLMFGVVDINDMDIQVTIGGRLGNENAGTVCASNILTSPSLVTYAPGAFSAGTYDWETDCRVMIYDAGVRNKHLPFDVKGAVGRTDRVGCKDLTDIFQLQVLGTFGVHREFEGPFKEQAGVYRDGFMNALKDHGLEAAFHQAPWIRHKELKHWDAIEYHEQMLTDFTRARREQLPLVTQVRTLMSRQLLGYLRSNRESIIRNSPEDYSRLQAY